ncbi:MAG: extracellular solute-binding protein [Clostridia bacterium]|nr:extracellular solute-binding protein [Clostridia bacterium]
MKIFKRIGLFALIALMTLQFAGCKKENSATNNVDLSSETLISKEPIELTVFYPSSKEADGQWKIFAEAAKLTNVSARVTVSKSNTDFNQAFNLALAAGDIPDIVETYDPVGFSQYGIEGAFVPLNEYFDECAPNIKKMLEENPSIKKRITASDGNIYYIPHIPGGSASTGWFIRTDWLKKLGLEIPDSTEELYTVFKAFKEKDPNGNGQADEVPFFGADLNELFPLWNARPDWYVADGKIKYGPYEPEYKEALTNIIKWYNEGLIDREILTRSKDPREKMLTDNIGGATNNWFGSTAKFNDRLKDSIPGFEFKPIAPPNGIELRRRPESSLYGWGVSASSKYIKEAIKYLDFWYSETGNRLMNFGVEGVHYDMVDGKPQFKAELLAKENVQKELAEFGIQMDIGFKQDFEYEKQWINQIAVDGMTMYENSDYIVEQVPPLEMVIADEEAKESNNIDTQIDTYASEMLQKWVLGAVAFTDESWNKYINELDKFGMNGLLEIRQNAYEKYNK